MKNKKVLIILTLIIAMFITGCGKKAKVEENSTENNSKELNCPIKTKHIHISDLTEKQQEELKIEYNSAILHTFNDSKIKSVIYKGKTFDYKELVSLHTDFNKLVKFIVENMDFINEQNGDEPITYVNEDNVKRLLTSTGWNCVSAAFFSLNEGDKTNQGVKKNLSNEFLVRWYYPTGVDSGRTVDSTYYGKGDSIHIDYFYIAAEELSTKIEEEFFVVLDNGTKVHMLNTDQTKTVWLIHPLEVMNCNYNERSY